MTKKQKIFFIIFAAFLQHNNKTCASDYGLDQYGLGQDFWKAHDLGQEDIDKTMELLQGGIGEEVLKKHNLSQDDLSQEQMTEVKTLLSNSQVNSNDQLLSKYDNNNIFAQILRGEVLIRKVHEDANSLAFYSNSQPENQVRILIIPKKPYISFDDFYQRASKEEIVAFFQTIGTIAQPFKDSGYTLQANHGAHSGQTVFHFHVHLNAPKPENYQYKA